MAPLLRLSVSTLKRPGRPFASLKTGVPPTSPHGGKRTEFPQTRIKGVSYAQ